LPLAACRAVALSSGSTGERKSRERIAWLGLSPLRKRTKKARIWSVIEQGDELDGVSIGISEVPAVAAGGALVRKLQERAGFAAGFVVRHPAQALAAKSNKGKWKINGKKIG